MVTQKVSGAVSGGVVIRGGSERYELSVYSSDGELLRVIRRQHELVPVTDDAVAAVVGSLADREGADEDARQQLIDLYLSTFQHPPTMPASGEILSDPAGNLWVEEYLSADGMGRAVDLGHDWTVFDGLGRWLGAIAIPIGFEPFEIGDDYVLGRRIDDLKSERVEFFDLVKP